MSENAKMGGVKEKANLPALFTAIAEAIRGKTGKSSKIKAADFPNAIVEIQSGTDTGDATLNSAGQLLDGVTAYAKGEKYTGNIPTKHTADLTVNGATVTVPAGYYASNKQKAVASGSAGTPSAAKGSVSNNSVSVTPSVTNTSGYITGGTKTGDAVTVSASELVSGTKNITASGTTDVTNYKNASVAAGSATTPATTITATPSISVSSGGLITASVSASKSVTPSVSAGYVSSGAAGTVTASGSSTQQLTAKAATTYNVSGSNQTIAAGQYLTGAQTIRAVTTSNLSAENIKKGVVVKVGDAGNAGRIASITGTYVAPSGPLVPSEYITFTSTPAPSQRICGPMYYFAEGEEALDFEFKVRLDDVSGTKPLLVCPYTDGIWFGIEGGLLKLRYYGDTTTPGLSMPAPSAGTDQVIRLMYDEIGDQWNIHCGTTLKIGRMGLVWQGGVNAYLFTDGSSRTKGRFYYATVNHKPWLIACHPQLAYGGSGYEGGVFNADRDVTAFFSYGIAYHDA